MTDDDLTRLRDEVAGVLAAHAGAKSERVRTVRGVSTWERFCMCGEQLPWSTEAMSATHRTHLADALLPLLARKIAEARGEVAFNAAHPDFQRFLHRVTKRAHDDGAAEVRARVEAVADEWDAMDAGPDGLGYAAGDGPDPFARTDQLRAALAEPTGPETTQTGPSAPISRPASPRRVSADHRDATDPEETK